MKKVVSLILSIVLSFTLTAKIDFSVNAYEDIHTCLTDIPCTSIERYTGNMGDSFFFHLDGSGPASYCNQTKRNGNVGLNGLVYKDGFEVWIARWNFGDNISWASATFDLSGYYNNLSAKIDLIKSFNSDGNNYNNFDTTFYFYGDGKLLNNYRITPSSNSFNVNVNVEDVQELKILVKDNVRTAVGTSFALHDAYLDEGISENDRYINHAPKLSRESAINYLCFLNNEDITGNLYDYENYIDFLSGDFSGTVDEYKSMAIAFSIFARNRINALISESGNSLNSSYNYLYNYLNEQLKDMSGMAEDIIGEYQGKCMEKIEEGLIELLSNKISDWTGIPITQDVIDWDKAILKGYTDAMSLAENVMTYIDYAKAAIVSCKFILSSENLNRYEYFASYIQNCETYGGPETDLFYSADDISFDIYCLNTTGAVAINAIDWITGKNSWIEHRETIQEWAKFLYKVEKYSEKSPHNYRTIAYSATCTTNGYTEHRCVYCRDVYYDSTVNALGHDFNIVTIKPTCVEDGYDKHTCSRCGSIYNDNYVASVGTHDYEFTKTVLSTCTAQGYDLYNCTRCNVTEKRNIVSANGHKYSFTSTAELTCTAQGYDLYTCSVCNSTEKRNIVSANGHKYSFTSTVEPTCTAQGYDLYTCSVCNSTEKRNIISSTGHSYEVTSNTATCTESGIKTSVCSKCGDTTTTEVSALGHSYSKEYTKPTCTESGGYTNTCTRCGDITYIKYDAIGHNYYVKERNLPNINSVGTIKYVCSKCNNEYVANIYPWDYDIIDDQNIRLTSYNAIDTEVVIPEEIDGFTVSEIGKETFEGKNSSDYDRMDSIISIYIPSSVTAIEDEAIPNVQKVYLDEDNESFIIEDNILYSCDYRKIHWGLAIGDDFYIKNGVEVINRLILLSNEMYNIYQDIQAGIDCSEKYDIDHIKGVSIHIPESYIGTAPTGDIVDAYYVDNNNLLYSSIDGVLYSKDGNRLISYPCYKYDSDFEIPISVKELEPNSFECTSKNNFENGLVIPRNVTKIEGAFSDASSFDVYVLNENTEPVWLGTSCGCNVYLYDSVIDGFKEKNSWINVYSLGDAPDVSCFDAIIEQVDDLSVDDYLKKSYNDIIDLINEQKTESNYFSTQTEFDNAVSKLITAFNNLVPYLNLDIDVCNGTVNVLTNYNSTEDGIYSILFGNDVTLIATANDGYEFVGWYDTINNLYFSRNPEYSFKLTTNTSLKAVFVKEQSATLTFTTYSNWVQSTVTKTIDEWNAVTSIDELLPAVPYRYGYNNGRWVYDNAEVLAKLQTGENVSLIPEYDEDDTSLPTPPSPNGETPVLNLHYKLDAEANVGSFVMTAGIPENCQLESVGILFYYKNADEFDPTKFELLINNKMLAGRFNTDEADDIYIINMNKMSAYKNWVARGYVTYYDSDGNLKTVYSNQINIVNREQV